jgi:uncharacterized phosphatase
MIYVIRHGQTDVNKEGRLQGRKGLPLNTVGRQQAKRLKEQLAHITFDYVFSSPQERAIQTAEIATSIKAITDARLDVFDLGTADGLKKEEVKLLGGVPNPAIYDGVENIQQYANRIFSFMQELESNYSNQEVNILLSRHKCTTGCIVAYFEGIPKDRNILKFSSHNGEYKTYHFKTNKSIHTP